jgi:uncharacterized small protein (DUF1192 family)
MPNSETQREIERLQSELQKKQDFLFVINEKLAGRRNSADWEQREGQINWKNHLEEEIPQLEAEIARLQATEAQTESKLKEKVEEKEKILKKWLESIPDLNKEEDVDFVFWIIKEKSEQVENFVDPEWVKEKVNTGEMDLSGLKQEFQDWKAGEGAKRERERERERETNEVDMANEKVVGGETVAAPESLTGERKEVEKGENSSEEANLQLEAESGKTSEPLNSPSGGKNVNLEKEKEQWLLEMIDLVFNDKLEKGDYQYDKESWKISNKYNRGRGISIENFINENFTENSEEFKNSKKKLVEVIENLEKLGALEERRENFFTRFLQEKYKKFAEAENFTPTKEEAWTWFGFDDEKTNPVFLEESIQEIKNPARKARLTGLLSEAKKDLKQLGERYRIIKERIQSLNDSLVESMPTNYDESSYWTIYDVEASNFLPIDEFIDRKIKTSTELNQKLKDFLAGTQRKWRKKITHEEQLSEIDRAGNTGESIVSDSNIFPYELDSSGSKSGDNPPLPVYTDETQESGKKNPPIPKGNGGWGIRILIGVVVVAGLAAIAALVVRVIKNQKKGEKTKK